MSGGPSGLPLALVPRRCTNSPGRDHSLARGSDVPKCKWCGDPCKQRRNQFCSVSHAAKFREQEELRLMVESGCKKCTKCKDVKSLSLFGTNQHARPKSRCRACEVEATMDWAKRNGERRRATDRRYWNNNRNARRAKQRSAYADLSPDDRRARSLKKFGLTLESFAALLDAQGGRCAACGTTEPGGPHDQWSVDHDHRCCPSSRSCGGCVRGVLCNNCNVGLGMMQDDPESLRRAADYIEQFRKVRLAS